MSDDKPVTSRAYHVLLREWGRLDNDLGSAKHAFRQTLEMVQEEGTCDEVRQGRFETLGEQAKRVAQVLSARRKIDAAIQACNVEDDDDE